MTNEILNPFLSVLSFLLGSCIGSFLNVCIYRIPEDESVVSPRSRCPHCKTRIAWYDNIPLVSFFALHGRCRACSGPISPRYFVVELLTAVLFLLIWLKFGLEPGARPMGLVEAPNLWLIPILWLGVSGLILATFVDIDHMIIPDRVSIGGMVAGLLLSFAVPELHGQASHLDGLKWSAIGLIAGGGILWTVAGIGSFIFRKEAMGLGDVKLLGAIGAFLGWKAVLFTVVVSSFVGSIVGISLVATRRKEMQSRIPYGPYLALAAVIWILWGQAAWDWWYGSLFAADAIRDGMMAP